MAAVSTQTRADPALAKLLSRYSAEITSRDKKSLEAAADLLKPGTEVFVAALPGDSIDKVTAAVVQVREAGLTPVPHIVARNQESRAALDELLGRLKAEAGLDRALVLGGDRDKPLGEFDCALQLIESGLFQKHGIGRIGLACYPEGHPRVAEATLRAALPAKLKAAEAAGLDVWLVSQFCFDSKPIVAMAERLRAEGVTAPLRVGVAGPADHGTLMKYAMICGVGASLRALKERGEMTKNLLAGETPEQLLTEVARAQAANPGLGVDSVHFFTFGSLAKSANWASSITGA
jgi:methylenetetrahydrofolate reductase (NADPH)